MEAKRKNVLYKEMKKENDTPKEETLKAMLGVQKELKKQQQRHKKQNTPQSARSCPFAEVTPSHPGPFPFACKVIPGNHATQALKDAGTAGAAGTWPRPDAALPKGQLGTFGVAQAVELIFITVTPQVRGPVPGDKKG